MSSLVPLWKGHRRQLVRASEILATLTECHVGIESLQVVVEPLECKRSPRMDRPEEAKEYAYVKSKVVIGLYLCALVEFLNALEISPHQHFRRSDLLLVDFQQAKGLHGFNDLEEILQHLHAPLLLETPGSNEGDREIDDAQRSPLVCAEFAMLLRSEAYWRGVNPTWQLHTGAILHIRVESLAANRLLVVSGRRRGWYVSIGLLHVQSARVSLPGKTPIPYLRCMRARIGSA